MNEKILGKISLPPGAYVIRENSYLEFPLIGDSNNIYVDKSARVIYRWDDNDLKYYKDTQDCNEIEIIDGGKANG